MVLLAYWRFAELYYRKNGKPTDEQKAIEKVAHDMGEICGELPANEFGPKMLKTVRQIWIDRGRCRNYINQNTGRVRRIFKWAVAEELANTSDEKTTRVNLLTLMVFRLPWASFLTAIRYRR